jgi:hypothetical protein
MHICEKCGQPESVHAHGICCKGCRKNHFEVQPVTDQAPVEVAPVDDSEPAGGYPVINETPDDTPPAQQADVYERPRDNY